MENSIPKTMEDISPEAVTSVHVGPTDIKEPVIDAPNRVRKAVFIFGSAAAAYAGAMYLAIFASSDIAKVVADSLTTYMMVISVAYIAGHSIDRSDILSRINKTPSM